MTDLRENSAVSYLHDVENPMGPNHHSFIIRVWWSDVAQEMERPGWQGYVTHVPSGDRHYFKTLEEITAFIQRYFTSVFPDPGE